MLITEELFLLLTTDAGKVEGWSTLRGYGLAGAVITDLVLAERVELSDDKDPRVRVRSREPLGDRVLDPALTRLAEKDGKRLSSLVADGRLNPERSVAQRLAELGVVQVEEGKMLGLKPARYPVINPGPERAVRERIRSVLSGETAGPQDATLLSILQGLGVAAQVLKDEAGGLGKKQLKARIEQAAADCKAGPAIKKSVDAMNAAIMTAVIIPAVTVTSN